MDQRQIAVVRLVLDRATPVSNSAFLLRATTGSSQEEDGSTPIGGISPIPGIARLMISDAKIPGPLGPMPMCPTSGTSPPSKMTEAVELELSVTLRLSSSSPSGDRKITSVEVPGSVVSVCTRTISVALPPPLTAVGNSCTGSTAGSEVVNSAPAGTTLRSCPDPGTGASMIWTHRKQRTTIGKRCDAACDKLLETCGD